MSSSAPCPVEGQPMFPPPTCNSGMWLASGVNYPADTKLLMTNTSREPEEPMQQKPVRIVLPREAQWITLSRMPPAPGRATLGAVTTFAPAPAASRHRAALALAPGSRAGSRPTPELISVAGAIGFAVCDGAARERLCDWRWTGGRPEPCWKETRWQAKTDHRPGPVRRPTAKPTARGGATACTASSFPRPSWGPRSIRLFSSARRSARRHRQNRISDAITAFAGSMLFVYVHIIWFGCWIGFGVEDYPYGLLTMIVSLEAIFLSTFVLISQNRADAKRQVIADQQWKTVQEEDKQNVELLDLSRQILTLTTEVRALVDRDGGTALAPSKKPAE